MGKRALVAAAVVVLIVAGAFVAQAIALTYREVSADPCQPEEPQQPQRGVHQHAHRRRDPPAL